jgi:PPK2 family polyphosphate:nucleotide phosphotransferase
VAKTSIRVEPGTKVRLKAHDPGDNGGYTKVDPRVAKKRDADLKGMCELQERLYAENRQSLLIVLQAMDAGGKDGTISHVMSGLNPQGCSVVSFKSPTPEELAHDFLWRVHKHVPPAGHITVFNRSHYEDVLIVRVHKLVPRKVWEPRYEFINNFEQFLTESGTRVVKFFLNISRDEQKARLQARLDDPTKRWKFAPADLDERKLWDDYQRAYEDVLTRCSTSWAPWHIIPANGKWYRNMVVADIVHKALREMSPRWPKARVEAASYTID